MRHRTNLRPATDWSLLVVAVLLLAALPAAADVYTIRLGNGTTFESRYQPKQAAWDTTLVTFVDETGTEIALPQALIAEVSSQSETKGYGRVMDTTTIDLGFMPNDLDQSQRLMQAQAAANPVGQIAASPFGQPQFIEPSAVGTGIPVGFVGGFGEPVTAGGFIAPTTGAQGPFTTPTNTGTPPPFTTPSPAGLTPAPPTSPQ